MIFEGEYFNKVKDTLNFMWWGCYIGLCNSGVLHRCVNCSIHTLVYDIVFQEDHLKKNKVLYFKNPPQSSLQRGIVPFSTYVVIDCQYEVRFIPIGYKLIYQISPQEGIEDVLSFLSPNYNVVGLDGRKANPYTLALVKSYTKDRKYEVITNDEV